ncbi:MAG: hypothetical protein PHI12_09815 [Dehalococcoidales bacterium]|nr:hypothetical protein [Dehalococcoidales bacterium]
MPCTTGERAIYRDAESPGGFFTLPVVAWIMYEVDFDGGTSRMIIGAVYTLGDACLQRADEMSNFVSYAGRDENAEEVFREAR